MREPMEQNNTRGVTEPMGRAGMAGQHQEGKEREAESKRRDAGMKIKMETGTAEWKAEEDNKKAEKQKRVAEGTR